ncbi:hypothetical protein [Halolactibacillus miurensis]|uniref:hypothetical protein n=1 Tax=Halolactibacillus miurensis TaxID=306541 RepID=UPI0011603118|nr:hypothetical protein [Halolactibacillus miurensis]
MHKKTLYRFTFIVSIMLIISSLYVTFIKEALSETRLVYLPSPPPAAIHHVHRYDKAISLTINYTGDKDSLPYLLDALKDSSVSVTLFLPLDLLKQISFDKATSDRSEELEDLFDWGGLINRKKETTITIPDGIHFLRQPYANSNHLKETAESGHTTIGASLTLTEPHQPFNEQLKQTLKQTIRPGDIIAIDLHQDLVNGTFLIQAIGDYLTTEGFQILPLTQLLFEEEKLKIERID